jgi:hypothetical protein
MVLLALGQNHLFWIGCSEAKYPSAHQRLNLSFNVAILPISFRSLRIQWLHQDYSAQGQGSDTPSIDRIARKGIVLAFHLPEARQHTEFAAAKQDGSVTECSFGLP